MTIVAPPLPPGPIDRHNSCFHPEKLHLKWLKPPHNTKVDFYSITISNLSSSYSTSSLLSWNEQFVANHRFKPGTNYIVTIMSISYSTYSQPHTEEFRTLREFVFLHALGTVLFHLQIVFTYLLTASMFLHTTGTPLLTITPFGRPNVPYLSNLEIQCTVVNNTDFPPTLETKWTRNQIDVNISDSKYSGSSLNVYNPKLVINHVDFNQDGNAFFQCAARNSEGWGTSEEILMIDVKGSMCSDQYISLKLSKMLKELELMNLI